jgi:type I restriction enzyme R subunit
MADPFPIRTFDAKDEYFVIERRDLPHWAQAGTIAFITWRTWDSIPKPVYVEWLRLRADWLRQHRIDPDDKKWREQISALSRPDQLLYRQLLAERWESALDECHGACVLRQPALAKVVADSLLHFDGDRYVVTDFVVMPNHVHLLVAFPSPEMMLTQCDSWKHYTATQINRALSRKGRFWEVDDFDHLVRSEDQFEYFRRYIADNPVRAHLRPGEFVHYSRVTA